MRSAGTRHRRKGDDGATVWLGHLFGGRRCYCGLSVHSLPSEFRDGGSRRVPTAGLLLRLGGLGLCFVSFAGAVVAVGRTILPSSSKAL